MLRKIIRKIEHLISYRYIVVSYTANLVVSSVSKIGLVQNFVPNSLATLHSVVQEYEHFSGQIQSLGEPLWARAGDGVCACLEDDA